TDGTGAPDIFLGDSLGLALADGIAYVAWTDTRSGSQDIRFTRFRVTPPPRALNDRFEPNDTSAGATNLGTINLLRVFPRLNAAAGDADYYRLTAGADGTLSPAVTGGATLQVLVTDANGNNPTSGNPLRDTSGQVIGQQVLRPVAANQDLLLQVSGGNGTVYSI